MTSRTVGAVVIAVALAGFALLLEAPDRASGYSPHNPIVIIGDANFTAANGVTSGSGSAADPYMLEAWEIDASGAVGIWIESTTAHFIIRGVRIYSANRYWDGIQLLNVSNGRVESSTVDSMFNGISVGLAVNVVLAENLLTGNERGIAVNSGVTVVGNSFSSNNIGMTIWYGTAVQVDSNTFVGGLSGVEVFYSERITLVNNTFSGTGVHLVGDQVAHYNSHVMNLNDANGRPILYATDVSGLYLDDLLPEPGQVIVANATDVRIANLRFSDIGPAIQVAYVRDATVVGNRMTRGSGTGIEVTNFTNVTVERNELIDGPSFYATDGEGLVVRYNLIQRSGGGLGFAGGDIEVAHNRVLDSVNGISGGGTDIVILANDISGDGSGIGLFAPSRFRIEDNRVVNVTSMFAQSIVGLRFPRNGLVVGNYVDGRTRGFYLWDGVNVTLYHNTLRNTTLEPFDNTRFNPWNDTYPSGGNNWPAYLGADNCRGPSQNICPSPDGIGDTPHFFDGDNADFYPLMQPWNGPPIAALTVSPDRGFVTTDFTFNASFSLDPLDGTSGLQFRWDWEDDGTWDTPLSASPVAVHRHPSWGTFTTRLQVMDASGLASETSRTVVVENRPPWASFTVTPAIGTVATDFSVDASGSTDLEDAPASLQVHWDWEDDGTWDTGWSSTKTATHRYASIGTFSIRAEIRDGAGDMSTDTRLVYVQNTPPSATFTVNPAIGTVGATLTFDASGSSDLEDLSNGLAVRWDFESDGVYDVNWGAQKTVQHTFASPGTYTVRLEVRDSEGLVGFDSRNVVVSPSTVNPPGLIPGLDVTGLALLIAIPAILAVAGAAVLMRRRRRAGTPPPGK